NLAELSASIAHEVNQPLAAIAANSRACVLWLLNEPANLERARESAVEMLRDAEAAVNIVNRVRALFNSTSKVSAPANLNDAIIEVSRLMTSVIDQHKARIELELAPNLRNVH